MNNKKDSLITSDVVYNLLKWDYKIDQKKANITFLNLGNLKTVQYHDWVPINKGGEIPWHRVQRITYGDKLLWDRQKKEYYPEVLTENDYYSNISILEFRDKKWIESNENKQQILPDNISIITLNCLIDKYNKSVTNTTPRLPVILKYIESYNADIICLQEITINMKKVIMDNKFIKNNYYVTSNEPKIFGQMILTKYKPLSQNMITFDGNHMKKYLHMIFSNNQSELIEIYNIHLTSNQQIQSDKKRDGQIDQLFNEIREKKVIIAGDFNNDDKMDYNNFYDTWDVINPNKEGYTFDYIENQLTSKTTKSFIRTRIDKFLFRYVKPNTINLAFNKPIDGIWASDHFGLLANFSVIEEYEDDRDKFINLDIIVKPGTILCLILEPKYWKEINKFRAKYDDCYNKISPHVTLFQKFVSEEEWYFVKDKIKTLDDFIIFNKVEIFNLTNKFAVVLTSDGFKKINIIRRNIENLLNLNIESKPHITIGIFETEKKALDMKEKVKSMIEENEQIKVSLNNITFMKKLGGMYQVYDTIGINHNIEPLDLILQISQNIGNKFESSIIGSRAYGIDDSDYDIVLKGDIELDLFCNKFVSFCKMSCYFIYVKYIKSKIPTINLLTHNNEEINLIYIDKKNQNVQNSIDSIKEIKKIVGNKMELFTKCYNLVRIWAKRRNIYGSKYGYFNGITWLILTLNIFNKIEWKNTKELENNFIRFFFKYYSEYDWNIPINIRNLPVKRETKSDQLVYICNIIDKDNIVRTLSPTTWNIILDEFERTKKIKNLNIIYEKKKLTSRYVKIIISDTFKFNRYEKQNQLISEIWKLCIKTEGIIPFINWIDKDNKLTYKFGISSSSDCEIIYSYFRKYLCLVEFL